MGDRALSDTIDAFRMEIVQKLMNVEIAVYDLMKRVEKIEHALKCAKDVMDEINVLFPMGDEEGGH